MNMQSRGGGGGEIKFWLPSPEGGNWKIKKVGGSVLQGQVFLKGGADTFPI